VDETIRDLERRAASDPTAWAPLARARLRAGAPAISVLAAVREGIRSEPASIELARVRDEALRAFFDREPDGPVWRQLFEREGTGGDRVVFSHDGALLAVAGRGVVVTDVERNRIVGAGYAGRRVRALAFLGRELLLDDEGLAHWDPESGRERARIPGTIPTIAVATAADATRGFAVTENGRIVRLRFLSGRVAGTETPLTLTPPPTAAVGWVGHEEKEDGLIAGLAQGIVLRSGADFGRERILIPGLAGGSALLTGGGLLEALFQVASANFAHIAARTALAPDHEAALVSGPEGPVLVRLAGGARRIAGGPAGFAAAAFSPCGSRLAILREDRLTVLQVC
jgi:hypothetical protein